MSDIDEAVDAFYSPPNEVDLASLRGDADDLLRVLLDRLSKGRRTVLPARMQRQTRWYGFAPSDREARRLLEEIDSWLGSPVTNGADRVLGTDDPVDALATRLTPDAVVLRADVSPNWQAEARRNVRSLADLWAITPERASDQRRPVGRVLRYFYESLAARDRSSAEDAFDEIRNGGLLSPSNVRFLRVELLGHLGDSRELLEDALLSGISQLRRPPEVTDHLARAADALFIPDLAPDAGDDELRSIAEAIDQAWPGLIAHPSQIRSISGARCLALLETLTEAPRPGVTDALRSEWLDDPLVEHLAGLLTALATPSDTAPPVSPVLAHYQAGEFDLCLDVAELNDSDSRVAAAVLQAAVNLGDAYAAARAVAYIDRLSSDDKTELLSRAVEGHFYQLLLEHNEGAEVPDGWIDWLRSDWPDRPDLLREWSSKWTTDGLNERSSAVLAGELLDALHDERRGRVRNGLPLLLRSLVTENGLPPSSIPLAVTILEIMLGSDPGRAERRAALDLFGAVLETGCSTEEYHSILSALRDQLPGLGSREADWLAGVLDQQLLSPVPDPTARVELFAEALGIAISWHDRIDPTEATLLAKVFADGDLTYEVPATDPIARPTRAIREFGSVGIYSLSESAAQTAGRWIKDEWPDVKVRLSHAHENNSDLEGMVQTSDVLLMQTSHAKHAATSAIERSAAPLRLVRVNGRGATALFRGLVEWTKAD